MATEVRAQYVDDLLRVARYDLITHRLPLFAACWVGTTALWSIVLMTEGSLRALDACVTVALQCGGLAVAYRLWRDDRHGSRRPIPRPLVSVCIFLGLSSTAMF